MAWGQGERWWELPDDVPPIPPFTWPAAIGLVVFVLVCIQAAGR